MIDPNEDRDPSLAEARRRFPFFYEAAGEDDVSAMDLLVLTSKGLVLNI